MSWMHVGLGRYIPLESLDWHAAANAGLSSTLFDIEANIREGDSRAGLDERAMQELHHMMQVFGIVRIALLTCQSFDEARLRRHRRLLQENRIDPQTGLPLDSKAVTRL